MNISSEESPLVGWILPPVVTVLNTRSVLCTFDAKQCILPFSNAFSLMIDAIIVFFYFLVLPFSLSSISIDLSRSLSLSFSRSMASTTIDFEVELRQMFSLNTPSSFYRDYLKDFFLLFFLFYSAKSGNEYLSMRVCGVNTWHLLHRWWQTPTFLHSPHTHFVFLCSVFPDRIRSICILHYLFLRTSTSNRYIDG